MSPTKAHWTRMAIVAAAVISKAVLDNLGYVLSTLGV